jgi:HlyD family secretion protein
MDREIAPRVRNRRLLTRLGIALAVIVAGLLILGAGMRWLRPSLRRSDVQTARVTRGSIDATIQATGTVIPQVETVISSPVEARVLRIDHHAGDRLHAGDAIVTLDTSATRLDLARLDAGVAQKESELAQVRLSVESEVATSLAQIRQKELDARILDLRAEQNIRMHAEGLVAAQDELAATTAKQKSAIELEQLHEAAVRARRAGSARIEAADLQLRTARNERDESRRQLALAMMRSDSDGILSWVVNDIGAMVRRGDVLARVADLSSYRVMATIADAHVAKLWPGMPIRVRVDDETSLAGTISSIDPRIENGVARFYVALETPGNARLRNNLRVDVLAITGRHANTLRVARGTLGDAERGDLFVIRNGIARRTPVRFGLTGDDAVEIVSGVSEGDEVIVSNMNDYTGANELRIH